MDRRSDDGDTTDGFHGDGVTPSGDAVDCWLRRGHHGRGDERYGDAAAILAAIETFLYPPTLPLGAAGPAEGRPSRSGEGRVVSSFGWSLDPSRAILLASALGQTVDALAPQPTVFQCLTCCHAYYARPNRYHRACTHTHVDLCVSSERDETGRDLYSVRVVNVDLPRWRHAVAFAGTDNPWPDHGAAMAAGIALARACWAMPSRLCS